MSAGQPALQVEPGGEVPYLATDGDRHLDQLTVVQLVADQFPELDGQDVTSLGAGWDHDVFLCGGVVFRFPKRAERVAWLTRETEIVRLAGIALGPSVPKFSYLGRPSAQFPYPFVGYRLMDGIPAGQPAADVGVLADDLGTTLTTLHNVDTEHVPSTPTREEPLGAGGHRADLSWCVNDLRAGLPLDLRAVAEPYLSGSLPRPRFTGRRVLAHNDICAEHVLVDAVSGHLSGLIDWTDAMVTDPVVDFVGLITIGDWCFVRAVLAAYGLPVDDDFGRRLEWLTRTMTLVWLGEAMQEQATDLGRHLAWVRRAFDE
ncbi:MAG: phosphotransferase family protein [Acidimicrobiales bacterium]